MRLSDIQPQYFPRLHYIARMLDSDVFVLRDDVQFVRNHRYPNGRRGVSYQAHTPINTPRGGQLLSVAVKRKSGLAIKDTRVSYEQSWARKHINVLRQHYRKSKNGPTLLPGIEALLESRFSSLAALNTATVCWAIGTMLDVKMQIPEDLTVRCANQWLADRPLARLRRIHLGSDLLSASTEDDPSRRIVELCSTVGAEEYLGGGTAIRAYLDHQPFRRAGIDIRVQDWSCPEYPQLNARYDGHIPDLSILDLLFNVPPGDLVSTLVPHRQPDQDEDVARPVRATASAAAK